MGKINKKKSRNVRFQDTSRLSRAVNMPVRSYNEALRVARYHYNYTVPDVPGKSNLVKARDWIRKKLKNLNKGIFVEFLLFVLLQGFDLFTNVWVANEAQVMMKNLERFEHVANATRNNYSVPELCSGHVWTDEKARKEISDYRNVLSSFFFFTALAAMVYTLNFVLWLFIIRSLIRSANFLNDSMTNLVRGKVFFLIAATVLEDIPLSTLAAVVFSFQQGKKGLVCWFCKSSGICSSTKILEAMLSRSHKALFINIAAISLTTLWKGVSSFFRWSKIKDFDFFFIRACTSVFAGGLYLCVVLTPAMTVLKYDYYSRAGVNPDLLKDIIDRLYVIGVIFWVVFVFIACCCPLLKLIRLTQ